MLRSYEPPSVRGTVSGLVPLHIDVSRRATPCAIIGPTGLTVERGLWARFCPRARTKTLRANGRFPGSGPLFGERTPGIVGRSARTLETGRLMVVTSALPDGTRPRIPASGRLTVGTDALTGGRRPRTPTSGRLTVGTRAVAVRRRTLTPASGRLMSDSSGLTGGRWKRTAARRGCDGESSK